uniref:Uncharacterized protein n=1 Tax=Timema genevievae TaxID=629358 RepID=A0A7R9JQ40_TIMGE|nr:unnamed protein product [Timema genevievae]
MTGPLEATELTRTEEAHPQDYTRSNRSTWLVACLACLLVWVRRPITQPWSSPVHGPSTVREIDHSNLQPLKNTSTSPISSSHSLIAWSDSLAADSEVLGLIPSASKIYL